MKVTRHGTGARLRLNLAEAHILEELLDELRATVEPGRLAPSDPVRQRLYPPGYEGADDADAFRELTEAGLAQERGERIDTCLAEVRRARSLVRTELVLDGAGADRWMRVLNDLRLAIGTRLDVAEDDDYELDAGDPDVRERAKYVWLTTLQDLLVTTVLG